jgi:hypothetical protein
MTESIVACTRRTNRPFDRRSGDVGVLQYVVLAFLASCVTIQLCFESPTKDKDGNDYRSRSVAMNRSTNPFMHHYQCAMNCEGTWHILLVSTVDDVGADVLDPVFCMPASMRVEVEVSLNGNGHGTGRIDVVAWSAVGASSTLP